MITGVKELIFIRDLENGQILLDINMDFGASGEKGARSVRCRIASFPVCMTWLSWQEIMALRTICGIII